MNKEELIAELESAKDNNNMDTLETLAKQAVEEYPEEALGYLFLADALYAEKTPNYQAIELCLAKGIELEDSLAAKLKFAQIKEEQGLAGDARLVYRKVLKQDEDNVAALAGLGRYEIYEISDGTAALEYFDKAIGLDPTQKQNYVDRAAAHSQSENWQEVLSDLDNGMTEEFNEQASVLRINALNWLGRAEETNPIYEKLIENAAEPFVYHYNYGKELLDRSQFEEAAKQLTKAAELTENADVILFRPLGQALFQTKDYEGALANFDKCVELDDTDMDAYLWRADTQMELNQNEAALADFDKALELIGDDEVLAGPILAKKGLTLANLERWEEAEPIFMKLAKSGMGKKEGYYGLAVVYHKQGDLAASYKFMKAASQSRHPDAKAYIKEHLGAYLTATEEKVLANYKAEFAKNLASAAMSKLFGTFWRFKSIDSKKLSAAPANFADAIKQSLAVFTAIITERGILLISEQKEELFTYKILSEKGNSIEVELVPLDGLKSSTVQLTAGAGTFTFSKEEGEVLNLVPQDLGAIPAAIKTAANEHLTKKDTTYLGDKANAIVTALF